MSDKLYTAYEAADACGLSHQRIRQIAKDFNIGRQFGRQWMFTEADLEDIRNRPKQRQPYRPRQTKSRPQDET